MHRPGPLRRIQHFDGPLDLAPAAEVDDVADRAAPTGAGRRLDQRMLAKAAHQLGRLFQPGPIDMNMVVQERAPIPLADLLRALRLSICPKLVLNGPFTTRWRRPREAGMARR